MSCVGICEGTLIAQTIRVGSSGKLFVQGWAGSADPSEQSAASRGVTAQGARPGLRVELQERGSEAGEMPSPTFLICIKGKNTNPCFGDLW